jgi:hypothetical protein
MSAGRAPSGPREVTVQDLDTPPLRHEDYPEINYWRKSKQLAEKRRRDEFAGKIDADKPGKGRPPTADAKNVAFWYFQDKDRTELSNEDVADIHTQAKDIWVRLCEENGGPIGGPWGKVSPRHQLQYFLKIEAKYPIL